MVFLMRLLIQTGFSRERIMNMTKWYFMQVGGEAHFECFWRMDKEDDEA